MSFSKKRFTQRRGDAEGERRKDKGEGEIFEKEERGRIFYHEPLTKEKEKRIEEREKKEWD